MKFGLYYPTKPWIVGQKFGETAYLSYYASNGIQFNGHNGIDAAAIHGAEVRAAHDGTAYWEVDKKQGYGVVAITDTPFEYKDGTAFYKTIYWHFINDMSALAKLPSVVNENGVTGYKVKAGDLLGYADSTGLSTGDHLHFGLKPMFGKDPYEGLNIEQSNGYYGAIDPNPYFNGKYAADANIPNYMFTKSLFYGQSGTEVKELQIKLKRLGYFPQAQEATGFYGTITRNAVFVFQRDYITNLTIGDLLLRGSIVGPKTIAALNKV